MTLDELTRHRTALLAARYRGVRTVEVDGRRIAYATDAEMAAALADLEKRIAANDDRHAATANPHLYDERALMPGMLTHWRRRVGGFEAGPANRACERTAGAALRWIHDAGWRGAYGEWNPRSGGP